jgi:neopullulanase
MTGTKEEGDGSIRKDFPGGWKEDTINAFKAEGRTPLQNEAWDYMQKLLHWRKGNKAVTEGSLIHYAPDNNGCYVYARTKDDMTSLVILNGSNKDQLLKMDRYRDVLGSHTKAVDVLSGQVLDLTSQINVPARGVYVMDLK